MRQNNYQVLWWESLSSSAGYAVAIGATACSGLVRALLPGALSPAPYLAFYPAVVVAAALGGVGPGLVATFSSLILVDFVFGRSNLHDNWAVMRQVIWVVANVGVSILAGRLREARARADRETAQARAAEQALREQVKLIDPTRAEIIAREMQRTVRERAELSAPAIEAPARALGALPGAVGFAIAGVSLLVLVGWILGLETLKRLAPGLPNMKANTAVCFLLAGVAILLRERRAVRTACAVLVCAVAGSTLAEYVSGADFGFDQILFRDTVDPHTAHPGRMVQATALGFLCGSVSLMLLGSCGQAGRRAQQTLAVGTGLIGMVAVLGYLYGVEQLYRISGYSNMALHTGASLALLGVGLLFAEPRGVMSVLTGPGPGDQLARRLLPAALLVIVAIGLVCETGLRQGFYGPGINTAIFALAAILALWALVLWAAHALNRADASRRETETQLRNQAELIDQAEEALVIREWGGAIRSWNRGAEALYGWPAAEALGQRSHVILRTEGPALEQIDAQLERTGSWDGELVHATRDGRRVIVECRQTAVRAADGKWLVLKSDRDITGRKQAEEALQESEKRYRSFVEASAQVVWTTNARGEVNLEIPSWQTYTGQSAEQARGFGWMNAIHSEDRERVAAAWAKAFESRGIFEVEYRLHRHDGQWRQILARAIPVFNGRGEVREYVGTCMDITDRKQAEENLRKSEERLALALRSAKMGVWRLDLDGPKRHFDDQVCRCLGIDPARFAGTAEEFYAAVHPEDRPVIRSALKRTGETGTPYEVEYRVVWRDGTTHHVASRGQLARNSSGHPQRIDGLVWDITEHKRAEEDIKASLQEKEVLLREIHHRVKNNMQVISSLLDLQADSVENPALLGMIAEMRDRVRSMALVHEKLYQSESLANVEFAEYTRSLLQNLWRAHAESADRIQLRLDLQPVSLSVVTAVPCGLLLNELVINALKHAFRGRSEGEVSVALNLSPEGSVCLSVNDNGVGLPSGLDWQQSRSLGLRLVHLLTSQLDGTLKVKTGPGTSFQVTFAQAQAQ